MAGNLDERQVGRVFDLAIRKCDQVVLELVERFNVGREGMEQFLQVRLSLSDRHPDGSHGWVEIIDPNVFGSSLEDIETDRTCSEERLSVLTSTGAFLK